MKLFHKSRETTVVKLSYIYLGVSATVPIVLTHEGGALPQFGAQLNQLEEVKSSFLFQSFIL